MARRLALTLTLLFGATVTSTVAAQAPTPTDRSRTWSTRDEALEGAAAELASRAGLAAADVACRIDRRGVGVATHLCEAPVLTRLILTFRLPGGAGWRYHALAETGMTGDVDGTGLWRFVHRDQLVVVGRYRHIERDQNGDPPTGYGPAIGRASADNETWLAVFVHVRVEGEWELRGEARIAERALFAFDVIRPDGADGAIEAVYTETRIRRIAIERWGLRVGAERHRSRGAWSGDPLPPLEPILAPGRWRWQQLLEPRTLAGRAHPPRPRRAPAARSSSARP